MFVRITLVFFALAIINFEHWRHLFFKCMFSTRIWNYLQIPWKPGDTVDSLIAAKKCFKGPCFVILACWCIWKQANDWIFKGICRRIETSSLRDYIVARGPESMAHNNSRDWKTAGTNYGESRVTFLNLTFDVGTLVADKRNLIRTSQENELGQEEHDKRSKEQPLVTLPGHPRKEAEVPRSRATRSRRGLDFPEKDQKTTSPSLGCKGTFPLRLFWVIDKNSYGLIF
jgi:hypothetical protein